ncbi:DUF1289 domain-containing protein [Burkholderia humptydooensis]|uniref:DUF1289 domain-containing protein n=2 Tax=Burkholderia humptydooensis TaxID=430531 RepID=A0A7U4P6P8_9BURK|nr:MULTISPECIES: DUF1289 domain-containing protein [Burkholderia]AJY40959.1 hypothetical protein BW21_3548 [Burkholderia sp. 2002721687]ALX43948.1 hypothetical protein AQ610_17015 [Burkholderia humptydooensis]EIP89692.1 hypothetical protein A33K_13273 [Burkholderia humptydooensis MSMB43]QPS44113.1 DUF1289 domain-containing protein [Burkholderia humptydooensis]
MSGDLTETHGATPAECAPGAAPALDAATHAPATARTDASANATAASAAAQHAVPNAGVPSPCTNVCRIDAGTGWCEGCRRTRDEIAGWRKLDDDAKRIVLARIAARRAT